MTHTGTIVSLHLSEIGACSHSIEDMGLTNLSSAYCKHVGNRSTDAPRELMKRDPTVNDIPSFQSTIEDMDLKNPLSAYSKHVGNRSTDAHRELMKRDPMVNDISFFQKDAQRALPLCRWKYH